MNRITLLILAVLPFLAGCEMNNGDIGAIYGTWNVMEVRVDGEVYEGWRDNDRQSTFFSFQNNICAITSKDSHQEAMTWYCTWAWADPANEETITLDFLNSDNATPVPGTGIYAPPAWLLLDTPGVYVFEVQWHGEKKMTWTTVRPDGVTLQYNLKRTW